MVCVGNDDDVRQSPLGYGALRAMRGALLIDHTTTSESLATELADAATGPACPLSMPRSQVAKSALRMAY